MQFKKQIIMALIAGVLLVSCTGQATGVPTVDVNAVMTAGIGTFSAALTQTQAAQATLATQTSSPTATLTFTPVSLNSVTPQPTLTQAFIVPQVFNTATPTGTQYTSTVNPSTQGSGCNNLLLIEDASIPAGTVMTPGQEFTKSWQVANTGTCDWVYRYRLVFVSGDRMGGEAAGLGKVIAPGKWTTLSVGLKAPSKPGKYTGNWRFGNQSGSVFGSTLTVSIEVVNPTNTPSYP